MKLHEYQSKKIFSDRGIPIPPGRVASSATEVKAIAAELGSRVVVKSQVLVGGRGKAGGIRVAESPEEAEDLATKILGMTIKGLPVRKVLVDQAVRIQSEIYLGITNDRSLRCPVMIASAEGGVEIEEVARTDPGKIIRVHLDPLVGLRDYQARYLSQMIEIPRPVWRDFIRIAHGLYKSYVDIDASLAEINPLVITHEGELMALDGKIVLDDNGLIIHPELEEMRDQDEVNQEERQARMYGLSYVKLDGNIGCMVNGAGLAMATMDVIKLYGGSPANFLDIGGGASAEKVASAIRIILSDHNVKTILFNVFGGITRCDEVARGILSALKKIDNKVPMVVRLVGTNEEAGRKLLEDQDMIVATSLIDAAQKAVKMARERGA